MQEYDVNSEVAIREHFISSEFFAHLFGDLFLWL